MLWWPEDSLKESALLSHESWTLNPGVQACWQASFTHGDISLVSLRGQFKRKQPIVLFQIAFFCSSLNTAKHIKCNLKIHIIINSMWGVYDFIWKHGKICTVNQTGEIGLREKDKNPSLVWGCWKLCWTEKPFKNRDQGRSKTLEVSFWGRPACLLEADSVLPCCSLFCSKPPPSLILDKNL